MWRVGTLAAVAVLLAPAAAHAAYTGTVDGGAQTVTLTGSGGAPITTGGGLVRHGDLGPGFASDADFDSTAPGDQTVPDSGGWSVNVTGGGKDTLDLREGEAISPITYASGHTFFPGGVPCIVRDTTNRHGAIGFSQNPATETRFCYPTGIARVNVTAGAGATQFTAIDSEKGVPIYFTGGGQRDDLSVAANVPSSGTAFHNIASTIHFKGAGGSDSLSFVDDRALAPATYTIGNGVFRKSGLPDVRVDDKVETIVLYPQDGKSTIDIGRTGAQFVQLFGDFFGQKGPYKIDARGSDAPVVGSASTGDDTILGSAFGDALSTGGGNDKVTLRDSAFDQLRCDGGTPDVTADTMDQLNDCPAGKAKSPLIGLLLAAFKSKSVKHGKRATLEAASTVAGKLTLTFKRGGKKRGTRTLKVKTGPNSLRVKTGELPKGSYKVSAKVRKSKGKSGPSTTLHLRIR